VPSFHCLFPPRSLWRPSFGMRGHREIVSSPSSQSPSSSSSSSSFIPRGEKRIPLQLPSSNALTQASTSFYALYPSSPGCWASVAEAERAGPKPLLPLLGDGDGDGVTVAQPSVFPRGRADSQGSRGAKVEEEDKEGEAFGRATKGASSSSSGVAPSAKLRPLPVARSLHRGGIAVSSRWLTTPSSQYDVSFLFFFFCRMVVIWPSTFSSLA